MQPWASQVSPQTPYLVGTLVLTGDLAMNARHGFVFVTEDPKWIQKVFVGGLVMAIPILDVIANGYQMQVIRNLILRKPQPLPAWNGIDTLFGNGLRLSLAVFALYIPAVVLQVIGWFVGLSKLWQLVLAAVNADTNTQVALSTGSYLLKLVVSGLASLLSLALPVAFLIVPVMALTCAKTNSLRRTLSLWNHIKFVLRHLENYVLATFCVLFMLLLCSALASVVSGITFFVVGLGGWLILSIGRFWSRMMWAYYLASMELKNA